MFGRPVTDEAIAWHAFDPPTLLERLRTGPAGLNNEEAARRLGEFGPNRLPDRPPAVNAIESSEIH